MSKVLEKIKQLKIQQKKIDFLLHILDSAVEYDHDDYKEVKDDVVDILSEFIHKTINNIEGEVDEEAVNDDNKLSPDEIKSLKLIANRLKNFDKEVAKPITQTQKFEKQTPQEYEQTFKQEMSKQDKIAFSLSNRHLANKEVTVNLNGEQFDGTVVGLDAPYIKVKRSTDEKIISCEHHNIFIGE